MITLGVNPTTIKREPGNGVVVWFNVDPFLNDVYPTDYLLKTDVYSKLMIKDEEVPHLVPEAHVDYFYAFMYMDIPVHTVDKVLKLTESLSYDTMKKEIFSRCHYMAANVATLFLAKQIAQGQKSLGHARQEYGVLIKELGKEEKWSGSWCCMGPWHTALTNYLFSLS